jgi:DNA-binding TFAR19-related protein (PDSD5 family)
MDVETHKENEQYRTQLVLDILAPEIELRLAQLETTKAELTALLDAQLEQYMAYVVPLSARDSDTSG